MRSQGRFELPNDPPIRIDQLYYKEAGLDYHFDEHRHTNTQWFLCVFGGMTILIDDVLYELHPEEAILIAPNARREPWCRERAPGYINGNFHDIALGTAAVCGRVLRLPATHRDDLHALIGELREPRADSEALIQALSVRLLIGLKRSAMTPEPALSALNAANYQDVISRADAFMLRNLHRALSRREIAAAVNLSEVHVARIMRATTGSSLVERLTGMRMRRAKALLIESTLSITQIAGEVGISSFSHFTKVFKRLVGVSPSDYRRTLGKAGK
jgi:AraC-like DNA-binding protein